MPKGAPPTDLPPGGWAEAEQGKGRRDHGVDLPPVELVSPENLEKRWLLAAQAVGLDPNVVYHPCSGNYKTPSVVFPNARVIYVEKDARAVAAFRKEGYEAHETSATEFTPDVPVDLLILLNPAILSEHPASTVRSGGYVFCNDYHGTASELNRNEAFEFVGVVIPTEDGYKFDKANLEDYWQEVGTDEEFRNARLDPFGAVSYEGAQGHVAKFEPGATDVLQAYGRVLDRARIEFSERMRALSEEFGGTYGVNTDPAREEILMMRGRVLKTLLPKKKGSVDDIFVFRKK